VAKPRCFASAKNLELKKKRNFYNDVEVSNFLKEVDIEMKLRKTRTNPFLPVIIRNPTIKESKLRKTYKIWVSLNRPEPFIINDNRKLNTKQKALSNDEEKNLKEKILELNKNNQIVSYKKVSEMAKNELEILDGKKSKTFNASNGWIRKFLKRSGLSSQAISLRSSSRNHRNPEDYKSEVKKFIKKVKYYIKKYGLERIVNFDETSFKSLTGQIRTIGPKNSKNQPVAKQRRFASELKFL